MKNKEKRIFREALAGNGERFLISFWRGLCYDGTCLKAGKEIEHFTICANGYGCQEVDAFLDQVIEDYEEYDEKVQELDEALHRFQMKSAQLQEQARALQAKNQQLREEAKA